MESDLPGGIEVAEVVRFVIPGVPVGKGSVCAFPIRRKDGRLSAVVTQDKTTINWVATARLAAERAWARSPLGGAIQLRACFWFPRPNCHYKSHRPGPGRLKPTAPIYHTRKPDEDKLQRALRDALTGVIYRDDSQIAVAYGEKRYADFGEMPRTEVEIRLLQNPPLGEKP